MRDGTDLAEQLLGLDGFRCSRSPRENEVVIAIETTASVTKCCERNPSDEPLAMWPGRRPAPAPLRTHAWHFTAPS
jgi:hypothetical protein